MIGVNGNEIIIEEISMAKMKAKENTRRRQAAKIGVWRISRESEISLKAMKRNENNGNGIENQQ